MLPAKKVVLSRTWKVSSLKVLFDYNYVVKAHICLSAGTLFLWAFWPLFNASFADGAAQHRAVIHTYCAMSSCCTTVYAATSLFKKEKSFTSKSNKMLLSFGASNAWSCIRFAECNASRRNSSWHSGRPHDKTSGSVSYWSHGRGSQRSRRCIL